MNTTTFGEEEESPKNISEPETQTEENYNQEIQLQKDMEEALQIIEEIISKDQDQTENDTALNTPILEDNLENML